jgi:hypothetical protein
MRFVVAGAIVVLAIVARGPIPAALPTAWAIALPIAWLAFSPRMQRWLSTPRARTLVVAASATCAAAAALVVHNMILRGVARFDDETVYLLQARIYATGRLMLHDVRAASFLQHPLILARREAFTGVFSPGWPALLSVFVRAHVPELAGPALAAVAIALIAAIARRTTTDTLEGNRRSALAAVIAGTSPWLALQAATYFAHVFALVLTAAALLCAMRRRFGLLAITIAVLILTRPLNGVVVLAASLLFARSLRNAAITLVGGAVGVAMLLWFHARVTGSPWKTPAEVYYDAVEPVLGCHRLGFGPNIGCPVNHGAQWPGYDARKALVVTGQRLTRFAADPLGSAWALIPFAIAIALHRARFAFARVFGALIALTVIGYAAFYYRGFAFGARFYFELLAVLIPCAAALLAAGRRSVATPAFAAVLAAPVVLASPRNEGAPPTPAHTLVERTRELHNTVVLLDRTELFRNVAAHNPIAGDDVRGDVVFLVDPMRDLAAVVRLYPRSQILRYDVARDQLFLAALPSGPMRSTPLLARWPFFDRSADPCSLGTMPRGRFIDCRFDAAGDFAAIEEELDAGHYGVFLTYLPQPKGAPIEVRVDGRAIGVVTTSIATEEPAVIGTVDVTHGRHRIEFVALGAGSFAPVALHWARLAP